MIHLRRVYLRSGVLWSSLKCSDLYRMKAYYESWEKPCFKIEASARYKTLHWSKMWCKCSTVVPPYHQYNVAGQSPSRIEIWATNILRPSVFPSCFTWASRCNSSFFPAISRRFLYFAFTVARRLSNFFSSAAKHPFFHVSSRPKLAGASIFMYTTYPTLNTSHANAAGFLKKGKDTENTVFPHTMIGLNHNKSKRKPTCPSSFPQKMLTFFSGVDIYRARSRHDDSFSKATFPQMTWTKWTVCGADVRSDVMPCAQFFFSDRFPVLPFFVSNMRRAASHIQINNFILSYYIWWRLLFLFLLLFLFAAKVPRYNGLLRFLSLLCHTGFEMVSAMFCSRLHEMC